MSFETVTQAALALEPVERARLLDSLWESLATDNAVSSRQAAWIAEAEGRSAAISSGQLETFDEVEVLQGLRSRLKA